MATTDEGVGTPNGKGNEFALIYDDGEEMQGGTPGMTRTPSELEMTPQSSTSTLSYTKKNYPHIAMPKDVPRPRGLVRQLQGGKEGHPAFTVPRMHGPVRKSLWSRIYYAFVLLNMILWLPLWLKLITIRRRAPSEEVVSIYDPNVSITLNVSTFEERATECFLCDKSNYAIPGISFPVTARVEDFRPAEKVQTASYVLLLASFDWQNWYVVNSAGILTGIPAGSSDNEVCMPEPMSDDDFVDDGALADDEIELLKTVTKKTVYKTTHMVRPF